ncbi:NBR1-Ig-like domain-containing protein, partial [Massilia sp. SM-13]|uniref:NBR1-Ig-like domain-containing protein n=1 Tax=Pseudoduganella rhizocola TaxID=3382643 RepID=UPI0038B47D25
MAENAKADNDATFVSQNIPATMVEGQRYTVSVAFKNTGTTTWTTAVSAKMPSNPGWPVSQIAIPTGYSVAVNASRAFSASIVAPAPGTYGMQWCLQHSTAGWFGACSDPVVVTVEPKRYDAEFVQQTALTSVTGARGISVVMKNTGNMPWTTADFKMGTINPVDNLTWKINRLTLTANVAPGANGTFTGTIYPPAEGGYQNLQWQMLMLSENRYIGEPTPNQYVPTAGAAPTINIISPETDQVFIGVGGKIQVPIKIAAIPTGIATITKLQLLFYNSSTQTYTEWDSVAGDVYDETKEASATTFTAYVRATDSFNKYTQVPLVIKGVADNGSLSSHTVPTTMVPSQPYDVTLTFRNSGGTTWEPGEVELVAVNPVDNSIWGLSSMPLTQTVAPNGTTVFSGTITAPPDVGTKPFQWRLRHSTRGLFGTQTSISVNVARPLPVVTLTTPTHGQIIDLPSGTIANVLFQGSATPGTAATISTIEVLRSSTVLATVEGSSINQTVPLSLGTNYVRLKATDNWGVVGYSPQITVTVKGNDASFVSHNVPASMQVGKAYTISITMKNDGAKPWVPAAAGTPDSYALGSQNPANNTIWRANRVMPTATVNPGTQVTFSLPITAPTTPGTYNFQWQMLQEGREWFGDPSTNVAVVVKPLPPTVGVLTAPVAGEKIVAIGGKARVRFQATATAGEGGAITKLEVLNNTTLVVSGNSGTLDEEVDLLPGTYVLKLRATDNFGQVVTGTVSTTVTVLANNATYVSRAVPTAMTAGQSYPVTISMRNSGTTTWTAAEGYMLGAVDGAKHWGIDKVPLPLASVAPNGSVTFSFNVTAPPSSGTKPFQWQMMREGVESFGTKTTVTNVVVTGGVARAYVDSPAEGSMFDTDASGFAQVRVQGHATPGDGAITRLLLLVNGKISRIIDADTFDLVIPLPPGTQTLSVKALDNVSGLVDSEPVQITVRGNAAEFVSQTPLSNLYTNEKRSITITMRNTGTTTWQPGAVMLMADNPEDNQRWGVARIPLAAAVAPEAEASFTFDVTAPAEPATYAMQWRMLDTALAAFGTPSTEQQIAVTRRPAPTATLSASPRNVRVAPGQAANITLAASATAANEASPLSKLELFQDTGSGYGTTPVRSANGPQASLSLDGPIALAAGSYRFMLRATDNAGTVGEAEPVLINVTDSPLLGLVSGVRSNATQQLQLVGWACRDGAVEALQYEMYVNAPPALGGTLVSSGTANTATELGDAAVRASCHTPDASHHFVIDLAAAASQYPRAPLYVVARASDGAQLVLPCEDFSCRLPDGLRIGLTSPAASNQDRYRHPAPAFLRAAVSGIAGTPEEVAFNVDGIWVSGVAEGAGAYSASKEGLASRFEPYRVYARVRYADQIVISEERLFYMDAGMVAGALQPAPGSVLILGQPATLKTVLSGPIPAGHSVKFAIQGVEAPQLKRSAKSAMKVASASTASTAVGSALIDAQANGATWSAVWTPTQEGAFTMQARLYDGAGAELAASPPAPFTVSPGQGSTSPLPTPVTVPPPAALAEPEAGTLPGEVLAAPDGSAQYSVALQLPPGSGGLQPQLSLNYSSGMTTGIAGTGWSIGGLSSIERCGKTVATDGRSDSVRFSASVGQVNVPDTTSPYTVQPVDRLCLDGQRLVLVNGDSANDAAYWANGAEYRTEADSFVRVRATRNGERYRFDVETRDGQLLSYGHTEDSLVKGIGRADDASYSWRLNQRADRSGNTISYRYSQDPASGESTLQQVSWGGNTAAGSPHYARVSFEYELRPDGRASYVAGTPARAGVRLKTITAFTDTAADGSGGVQGLRYALEYQQSPSSGRSLLSSLQACDRSNACLAKTSFSWGASNGAARTFAPLGGDRTGPDLGALGTAPENPGGAFSTTTTALSTILVADFNSDGKSDIIERYRTSANGYQQRLYESSADGSSWNISTPFPAGVDLAVMEAGDFDGDGLTDILVASEDPMTYSQSNWRMCWGRLRTAQGFDCNTPISFPAGSTTAADLSAPPLPARAVKDFNNDGKDDLFLRTGDRQVPWVDARYQCLSTGSGFNCQPAAKTKEDISFGAGDERMHPAGSVYADMDADGRADHILLGKCSRQHIPEETGLVWVCESNGVDGQGSIHVYGETEPGAVKLWGEWFHFPNQQTMVMPPPESGTLTADMNADGYTDVVFGAAQLSSFQGTPTGYSSHVCYSKGDGNADCRTLAPTDAPAVDHLVMTVADFDGDGVPDVLRPNVDTWNIDNVPGYRLCRLGGDASAHSCQDWTGPTFYGTRDSLRVNGGRLAGELTRTRSMFLGDFNGDGKPDIVTYVGGSTWRVHSAANQAADGEALDRLVRVTNGLGRQTLIEYGLAGDPQVYAAEAAGPDGQPLRSGKRSYPSTPLVRLVRRDNGPGGWQDTRYDYAALAADPAGRGSLGFGRVRSTDLTTNIVTTQWFNQAWPHAGSLRASTSVSAGGVVLAAQTDVRATRSIPQANGSSTIISYVASSELKQRDLDNSEIATVASVNGVPDVWGNITQSSVSTSKGGGASWTVLRTSTFDNFADSWLLGKLRNSTETRTSGGVPLARTMDFSYDAKGRLESETRENGDAALRLKTTYGRDGFGNVASTTLEWLDPVTQTGQQRLQTQVLYDSKGRFPASQTNALGHSELLSFDSTTGARLGLIDANGLLTSWGVDGFGRPRMMRLPDGRETWTFYKRCTAACPPEAAMVTVQESMRDNGTVRTAAPVLSYSDSAGHVLRTVGYSLDGRMVATDVRYDGRGRPAFHYWPRFIGPGEEAGSASGAPAGSQLQKALQYDDLDRVIQTNTLDELGTPQRSKTDYHGPVTVQTNALNRTHTEQRDLWGRLALATDALGNQTVYEYDAWNNLSKVTDPLGNVTVIGYDGLGRKTALQDPDLGLIEYKVDPLGQVWKQMSPVQREASPQIGTRFEYDALGRMTARNEKDLAARWVYDSDGSGHCALGKSCGR